jgi:hypothetical protein
MRSKVLPIILPSPAYAELERRARAEERDPVQQARYILRRALTDGEADRDAAALTADPRAPIGAA